MKRRDFLVAAPMVGVSGAWAGANERIRVAVLGLGGRGGDLMLQAARIPGVEVGALCDPDETRMEKWGAELKEKTGKPAALVADLRRILDDRSIDAVTIASCNHWHAPSAVWACQAGKHVYVEKPVCHNLFEGRKLVEAARKYNRIVQGGTQRRSNGLVRRAIQLLREGVIGDVYMARSIVFGDRGSIGFREPEPPPSWLHWDLWLGPAAERPFHHNLVHYNWHWFWDFGNGELGNNGSHQVDVARWGLNKGLPTKIHSTGGRFGYKDQGETPNTQISTFEYDDGAHLVCETRGHFTNDEAGSRWGTTFYGSKGYMIVHAGGRYEVFLGRSKQPEPDMGRLDDIGHYRNFIDAIRAGKREMLQAEIEEIYLSCAICLLGNIAYRVGRRLQFDPARERFVGDPAADRLLTREYRKPFVVPEKV